MEGSDWGGVTGQLGITNGRPSKWRGKEVEDGSQIGRKFSFAFTNLLCIRSQTISKFNTNWSQSIIAPKKKPTLRVPSPDLRPTPGVDEGWSRLGIFPRPNEEEKNTSTNFWRRIFALVAKIHGPPGPSPGSSTSRRRQCTRRQPRPYGAQTDNPSANVSLSADQSKSRTIPPWKMNPNQ